MSSGTSVRGSITSTEMPCALKLLRGGQGVLHAPAMATIVTSLPACLISALPIGTR